MPLYGYECLECNNVFEVVLPLKDYKKKQPCPLCGANSRKQLSIGLSMDDHPAWLDDYILQGNLQDMDDPATRPILSRQELNNYLKDNGISQGY